MISKAILVKAKLDMNKYKRKLDDPMAHQEKLLFQILKYNKDTTFGLDHNFASIQSIKEYQETVPLKDYFQQYHYFEQSFEKDGILSKDPVVHWIQTTGTLSTPKIIPITQEGVKRFSDGNSRQFFSYLLDKPGNEKILDGKIFAYIGQSRLGEVNGLPVGYVSGVATERLTNPILAKRVTPPLDIINIVDWKERLWQTMLKVAGENITFISGITPVVLGFLRSMKTTLPMRLNEIKDPKVRIKVQNSIFGDEIDFEMLWPNLQLLASTGVAVESYKPLIRELLGDVSITEMYAASEGHFAFQLYEDDPGLYLNFDNYFFEFLDTREPNKILLLDEVEKDVPYELIITNTSGLYRYNMHDVITFKSLDPPQIHVRGRTSSVLNIGSEKVSEDQLALVISKAMQTLDKSSVDYILSGTIALPLRHKIYIEMANFSQNPETEASQISEIYDELMKKLNTSYDVSRGQASLTPPEIHLLKEGAFRVISERKAERSGQLAHSKVLHIVQPEDLEEYIDENMIEYSHVPEESE